MPRINPAESSMRMEQSKRAAAYAELLKWVEKKYSTKVSKTKLQEIISYASNSWGLIGINGGFSYPQATEQELANASADVKRKIDLQSGHLLEEDDDVPDIDTEITATAARILTLLENRQNQ